MVLRVCSFYSELTGSEKTSMLYKMSTLDSGELEIKSIAPMEGDMNLKEVGLQRAVEQRLKEQELGLAGPES